MRTLHKIVWRGWTLGAMLALAACGTVALAQGPEGPEGPPPPGPEGPHRPGPGRPPFQPVTAVEAPLPVLARALTLSEEQKDRIRQIQQEFHEATHALMPPPPDPGSPPPDPAERKALHEKILALAQAADKQIRAILSDDQAKTLGRVLRDINDFRLVGIPGPVAPQLKLSADQRAQIGKIAEKAGKEIHKALDQDGGEPRARHKQVGGILKAAHEAAFKVLTDDQRTLIEQFREQHGPPGPHGPH